MLSINTNLSSMIAQNSMKTSTAKLDQAIERMTTGAKLNHAKDNAANYSIATNITTKMGALRVAEDNALQGLEMISSTSENLSIVEDKLARMRALSTQALSGTYSSQSLNALNLEADALLKEINRINESATYNGIKLFNTKNINPTNAGKELSVNSKGFLKDVKSKNTDLMLAFEYVNANIAITDGEYSISTKEDLEKLATMTNAGLISGGQFYLANDIDLNGSYTTTIGTSTNPFRGIFDGNGYSIRNMTRTTGGLFGTTAFQTNSECSEIRNLKLENVNISKLYYGGAIVCVGEGLLLSNCSVKGNIIGVASNCNIGGVAYECYKIEDCYFNGSISGTSQVGGISVHGSISRCKVSGTVKGSAQYIGGISAQGNVLNSSFEGAVIGYALVGGIVARSTTVEGCYFNGSVQANHRIGGIMCAMFSHSANKTIKDTIFIGDINVDIVGKNSVGIFIEEGNLAKISNCYYNCNNDDIKVAGSLSPNLENLFNLKETIRAMEYTLQVGSTSDCATSTISCTTYIDFGGLKDLLTSGVDSAQCLAKIDELVEIVSLKQTELGTMENRLMSVLDEISTQYENLASSRSTIRDVDMAKVGSVYIKQQILQDASATLHSSTQIIQYQNVMGLLQSLNG